MSETTAAGRPAAIPGGPRSGRPVGARWRSTPSMSWRDPRLIALVVVVAGLLAVAFWRQQAQVRVDKDRAVAIALAHVSFKPTETQVRLVRQGMGSRPYWAVSLSIPKGKIGQPSKGFDKIAVVRIDANTGTVAAVTTTAVRQ